MWGEIRDVKRNGWFLIGFALCFMGGMALLIKHYYGAWAESIADSMIYGFLVFAGTFVLNTTYPYLRPSRSSYKPAFLFPALLTFLVVFTGRAILQWVLEGHHSYLLFLDHSMPLRIAFMLLLFYGASVFILWQRELEGEIRIKERESMTEKLSKEAELFYLRQQLQPHFLFNSLNSINALIGVKPEKARDMIQQLADFFRLTIQKDTGAWESLEKEWQRISLYLNMEKMRFGHRLEVQLDLSEDAKPFLMPPLLIQPLIENAIKFGLYGLTGDVKISIECRLVNDQLQVCISNPFDPDAGLPKGTGFGLESVQRRLYLLFGRNDLVSHTSTENTFIVTLKIPRRQ